MFINQSSAKIVKLRTCEKCKKKVWIVEKWLLLEVSGTVAVAYRS